MNPVAPSKCLLCGHEAPTEQLTIGTRPFFECPNCDLLFVHPSQDISPAEEKERYTCHNNNVHDPNYLQYLSRLTEKLIPKLSAGARGLDFGCGPTQALGHLFRQSNFELDGYDPFFGPPLPPSPSVYDFITCTEAAEHFADPCKEFARMQEFVRPGGWIGIMTNFREGERRTPTWWYLRDKTHRCFYSRKTFEMLGTMLQWSSYSISDDIAIFQSRVI